MVESWRGFCTLLSTSGTFSEYSDIVENDILTTQRFLDVSRFLHSGGWQVWKVVLSVFTKVVLREGINATQRYPKILKQLMLKVSINGMRLFFPDNSIDFVFLSFFFQTSLEENKGKSLISTAYLTNIRLHSRFPRDFHSSPS